MDKAMDNEKMGTRGKVDIQMDVDRTIRKTALMAFFVVLMGAAASASFLYLGISNDRNSKEENFYRRSSDVAKEIRSTLRDYETAASWIHACCRRWREDAFSRKDFRAVYEYIIASGLDFYAAEWIPNVSNEERPILEKEAKLFYDNLEDIEVNYTGFVGFDPAGSMNLIPRSEQEYYFPIHYLEPLENLGEVAHYDLYSSPYEQPTISTALETWSPTVTGRFRLLGQGEQESYSVVLYHPGVPLPEERPRDLSNMVIQIKSFLIRSARYQSDSLGVYLFDSTNNAIDEGIDHAIPSDFLGGLDTFVDNDGNILYSNFHSDGVAYSELRGRFGNHFYQQEISFAARRWTVVVVPVDDTYEMSLDLVITCGTFVFVASLLLAIWMIQNMYRSIHLNRVIMKAAAEAAIVSNLFPTDNVRERMIQDVTAAQQQQKKKRPSAERAFLNTGKDLYNTNNGKASSLDDDLSGFLSSERIFGSRPIAELHPYTTVMFADLVGFTAWSSVREPSHVFQLLETIYFNFDTIAKRRNVFKVETVGDCYVAVAGIPEPRKDDAVVMARFAADCLHRLQRLVHDLEITLGPDTGDLRMRIGLHSGQCTAGVLRGDKGRFQLFGDTMNIAARMESTGIPNKIQLSQETAELLIDSGREKWLVPRDDFVDVKGKGTLQTYFLKIVTGSRCSRLAGNDFSASHGNDNVGLQPNDCRTRRLVEWNVEVLSGLLRKVVARREAKTKSRIFLTGSLSSSSNTANDSYTTTQVETKGMVLDEVQDIIDLPEFNAQALRRQVDPKSIQLDAAVVTQLTKLVSTIASMYRYNPFHNFEHASHVTMSVLKMLSRIVNPKEIAIKKEEGNYHHNAKKLEADLHDHTFGITSDPLIDFACALSALIHDVDHQGVPNMTLIKEKNPLALKYSNKSVAEQNSVDLAWDLLMSADYKELRNCICADHEEFVRFRQLIVNSVMATDIMDKELGAKRKARWNAAFDEENSREGELSIVTSNRKATIVIEHMIQASDVAHTMQHWHIYRQWNERFFQEMYSAYKDGRLDKDPSLGWYKGEMGFFDYYVIPLARKLFTCGVFGVSSDEYLNYAILNRKEWEKKGESIVKQYIKNYEEQLSAGSEPTDMEVEENGLPALEASFVGPL